MKKKITIACSICLLISTLTVSLLTGLSLKNRNLSLLGEYDNSVVFSSENTIIDGQISTTKGATLWAKGDSSSGVTWNNGNNKISILNGGYIQNLSVIHGIQSVRVEIESGCVQLFHGYKEPNDLEIPFYGIDKTFTSTDEYYYPSTDLPSYFRIRANENSVIKKIVVKYDCSTTSIDSNDEDLSNGLENSYIDAGTIAKYATTTYVSGDGNTSSASSKRALRVDFKKTTNNYFMLNLEKNKIKGLSDAVDISSSTLTFKAKFSSNVTDFDINLTPFGKSWIRNTVTMTNLGDQGEGWYKYSYDFEGSSIAELDDVYRFEIKPTGITTGIKSSAYVIFDEIKLKKNKVSEEFTIESINKGLENMVLDSGSSMTNSSISFDRDVTYGSDSISSMLVKPGSSKSGNYWMVTFCPESDTGALDYLIGDFREGYLTFEYKPVGLTNPETIVFKAYESWSSSKEVSVKCTQLEDGWYRFNYKLSNLAFTSPDVIRISIKYQVESGKESNARLYLDNIRKVDKTQEDISFGLENSYIDAGMSCANDYSIDYDVVSGPTSFNSIKGVINGSNVTQAWQNSYAVIFQPNDKIRQNFKLNSGTLEAKLRFSGDFPTKKIIFRVLDESWNGASFKDIVPTSLGDGWYQVKIDLSSLSTWSGTKSVGTEFDFTSSPVRFGFGYQDLSASNLSNKTVWIDDIFYYNSDSLNSVTHDVWQAKNTENVLLSDAPIANRAITSSAPLKFESVINSKDSAQIMVRANSHIDSIFFRPGVLRNSSGDKINPDQFETLFAKYIYISDSIEKNKTGYQGTGYYPDALVPQENIIEAGENTISSGNEQSFWINCKTRKDQTPGTYTGYGILMIDGVEYTIPMNYKVYDACFDDVNHSKSCFLTWDEQTEIGEGASHYNASMRKEYFNFINDHGINASHLMAYDRKTYDGMDKYESFAETFAREIMPNPKVSIYRIPVDFDNLNADVDGYLKALANRNVVEWDNGNYVNFFDKAIFYVIDEPIQPSTNEIPEAWVNCKAVQTAIHNTQNDLATTLVSYPEILANVNKVRNVTPYDCAYKNISGGTYNYIKKYPNLFNDSYLGVPCPLFTHVTDESVRETYFNTFDEVWFYGCINPQLPYPSYHTDTPLITQRLIKWMQYDYGFGGEVYFCTNYFSDFTSGARDVWTNALTDSKAKGAGDGQLIYPGQKYGVYGPISTFRLETIRNAQQDYEMFYLLDQNIDSYNKNAGSSITSARDLLTSEFAKMFDGTKIKVGSSGYTTNEFETIRSYLLSQLELI